MTQQEQIQEVQADIIERAEALVIYQDQQAEAAKALEAIIKDLIVPDCQPKIDLANLSVDALLSLGRVADELYYARQKVQNTQKDILTSVTKLIKLETNK